ncbi:MAG: glycyl radical protein, partial [Pseudobutyrivibrio sp.]|nr:glycyl radical protein [Pseudobutyrivibrio sp.]
MGNVLLSPQEERIEKNKGSVALSGRAQKIFNSFQNSKSVVDVQRAKYFTESFKKTEGQALSLRWAKALYNIAENIEVDIDDYQLIAGRGGKQGKYGIIYPELDGCFLRQFVHQASSRVESPFEI